VRDADLRSDHPPATQVLTVNVILTDRMVTKLRTTMLVGAIVILSVQLITLSIVVYIALR